ncbi:hypothetical protein OAT67_09225, partial [Bacteriovoracaceae bacterium]|nr:hypothetical protein [Bacteriovoracaceae bacterium]
YSCTDSKPPFAEQVGYYKNKEKGRALTFILPSSFTEDELLNHAKRQPNTNGKVTVVFYYDTNEKAVDPTQMNSSLYNVILTLARSDYSYRFDKYPDGSNILTKK